jgi:hypothetical protein
MACRHCRMMDAFYAAREAWLDEAERVTKGYATELTEYKLTNPMPQLGDYMKASF